MQTDDHQLPILVKIIKKRSQLNVLHLNLREDTADKILAQSKLNDWSCLLRSLSSKYCIIEKFLIRESDDSPSQISLNQSSLISDKDMFFELSFIKTFQISSRIKVHLKLISTESKLLFSQKVLDVQNLVKRSLSRMNAGFMVNQIFEVDILGNSVVLNISKIENEFGGSITNQAFICDNISLLEVTIDFTSLFKFSSFYQAAKCLYFKDSDIEEQRVNNKLSKLFSSYFQAEDKKTNEEFSFFNIKALALVIQDIQGQSQEARKNQIVPLIKRLLEQKELLQEDQEVNQVHRKIKTRYLNLKKHLSSQNSNSLLRLLKELSMVVNRENETSKDKKVIFVIDNWELVLEPSKSSTSMVNCAALMDFVQIVPSLILIQKQKDKVYQEMSPQIFQLYI